jgi:hypothetical protein
MLNATNHKIKIHYPGTTLINGARTDNFRDSEDLVYPKRLWGAE